MNEAGREVHDGSPSWLVSACFTIDAGTDADIDDAPAAPDLDAAAVAAFLVARAHQAPADPRQVRHLRALVPAFAAAVDAGGLDEECVAAIADEVVGYPDAAIAAALDAVLPTAASLPADVLADALAARLFSSPAGAPANTAPSGPGPCGTGSPAGPPSSESCAVESPADPVTPDPDADRSGSARESVAGRLAALRLPGSSVPSADGPATVADDVPVDATPADATPADATPADATPADATPADATPADSAEPRRVDTDDLASCGAGRARVVLLVAALVAPPTTRSSHLLRKPSLGDPRAAHPGPPRPRPAASGSRPPARFGTPARGPPPTYTADDPPTSSSWDAGRTDHGRPRTASPPRQAVPRPET